MGHSHSHRRLRSISSSRNCGEFTEVVDLEFSDAVGVFPEDSLGTPGTIPNVIVNCDGVKGTMQEGENTSSVQVKYPRDLLVLKEQVEELDEKIKKLSPDELFVYFPSLKDDLHNCWQKVYSIKEENSETKTKKHEVIDHIRELLRRLNDRLQRREFRQ